MNNNCNVNDVNKGYKGLDPRDAVQVVGGSGIQVQEERTPNATIYTVSYVPYAAPTVPWNVDVPVQKVGVTVPLANFTARIDAGSTNIVSRSMVPDKGLDLAAQMNWSESNVLGTEAGLWPQFNGEPTTISVTDAENNTIEERIGVEYRNLFYMGFSREATMTEAIAKSLGTQDLLTSILSKYREFTYNYSVLPSFLYWVFPADTPGFTAAFEGPLPVPLYLEHANIDIEDEGITKQYRVIRTAVRSNFVNSVINLQ